MRLVETPIEGVFVVEPIPQTDRRGFFARTWSAEEFRRRGLASCWVQTSMSRTHQRGTIRGLHLQLPPSQEVKLVRCTAGSIYDVVVDVRDDSPTAGRTFTVELDDVGGRQLYIPAGVAHGFQTLADHVDVSYAMDREYDPAAAAGCRFDDPQLALKWPLAVAVISDRDVALPGLADLRRAWQKAFEAP